MKEVSRLVSEMTQENIIELERNGQYAFNINGQDVTITTDDVEIHNEDIPGWLVANEGKLTVALEVEITEELRKEGIARELVNRIQNIRKSNGYEITDKINITISKNELTDVAVNEYNTYICNQVLANNITLSDDVTDGIDVDLDIAVLKLKVEKI